MELAMVPLHMVFKYLYYTEQRYKKNAENGNNKKII